MLSIFSKLCIFICYLFYLLFKVGDIDFYPNGGIASMAGCEGESVAIYCSHVRAVVGFIYTKYNTEAAKVFGCSFVFILVVYG